MTAKHTPGPWRPDDFFECKTIQANLSYGGDLIWTDIAEIYAPDELITSEETEANMHLIAAAPDLLEALQRLLNWGQRFSGGERAEDVAFARRVVAKAIGEQP